MAETLPHADVIAYPTRPMGEASDTLRFGDFTLDLADRRLLRDGERVDLGSRYFDALALLCAHPDTLVTKDRFMEEVWKGIPVTDEALTQCIRTLRRALGDDAAKPRFIETVPKHGYRFVAPVKTVGPDESEPPEVDKPPLARAAAARSWPAPATPTSRPRCASTTPPTAASCRRTTTSATSPTATAA